MSPLDDPHVSDTGQRAWTNKHDTYTQPLRALYDVWNLPGDRPLARYVDTTHALMALVGDAQAHDARVRALGGGWSLSPAPATEGYLVNTKPLNLFFRVSADVVAPGYAGDRDGLWLFQCGNSIAEVNRRLREAGRSMPTTGASNGQTIAGAMATGTHGSAFDFGAIPEAVVGLHVVVGADRHVWLERATPVTDDAFARQLGAEIVRDDEIFAAALVSFGSFGIVHGVLVQSVPTFLLHDYRRRVALDGGVRHAGLRRAIGALDFSGLPLPEPSSRPYHFEVVVNPYDVAKGIYVTAMYRRPYVDDYAPPVVDTDGLGPGDGALAFMGALTDVVPASVPTLVTALMGRTYTLFPDGVLGTIGEIFASTTTRGRASSTALGIPLDRAAEALDAVMEVNDDVGPFAGTFAMRFVRRTSATLGFTRHGPATCVLELDGAWSHRTERFYRRAWDRLAELGIPHAFHWGKMMPTDAQRVRTAYGADVDRWRAARGRLLDARAERTFSSRFTDELGLTGSGDAPIVV